MRSRSARRPANGNAVVDHSDPFRPMPASISICFTHSGNGDDSAARRLYFQREPRPRRTGNATLRDTTAGFAPNNRQRVGARVVRVDQIRRPKRRCQQAATPSGRASMLLRRRRLHSGEPAGASSRT